MPALQRLSHFFFVNLHSLSKDEESILEAELFIQICNALKEMIRQQNKEYFCLMNFSLEKENAMLETNFIRCIINDILLSEEYNLTGIACYTNTPEDVVFEIASGQNTSPSLLFSRKIIELHRSVRVEIYSEIIKKINKDNLIAA